MTDFLPAQAHGKITEIFPNVFSVTGSFRFAPGLSITRNMTIVRQNKDELVLVNSVRLSPEGEQELEELGKVKHVVRIGGFHGADDPYFKHRYGVPLWAPAKVEHTGGLKTDEELRPGHCPIDGAEVFLFDKGKMPEAALLVARNGGILITCDSYQNWTTFEGCSFLGKLMMRAMGFGPTLIGGPWVKRQGPEVKADFERLLALPFANLAPAHGTPIEGTAKEGLKTAMAHRFGAS